MSQPNSRFALLSVSDKTGIIELARNLRTAGFALLSTGGTAKVLLDHDVPVTDVGEFCGDPEILDGRVKTLGRKIMAAILARRQNPDDRAQLKNENIPLIDVVVCNLYPFRESFLKGMRGQELIEQVDIGGPTLIRAAAKNYRDVTVVTQVRDYSRLCAALKNGGPSLELRAQLALEAFRNIADYDRWIAEGLARDLKLMMPTTGAESPELHHWQVPLSCDLQTLRYGENSHQKAWVYSRPGSYIVLQGKEMSYNNYLDVGVAVSALYKNGKTSENRAMVSIVKHQNACGLAESRDPEAALKKAWSCDPVSAFGGIVGISAPVSGAMAEWLSEFFIEAVCSPEFSPEALEIFKKKKNVRLVQFDRQVVIDQEQRRYQLRSFAGGIVVQEKDCVPAEKFQWQTLARPQGKLNDPELWNFGIHCATYLKSNAVCLVRSDGPDYILAGAGMGNPNRLLSFQEAVRMAQSKKERLQDLILVSDAFFPFDDIVKLAAELGIGVVLQPGGSLRDAEVIATCNQFNLAMAFTGLRHFSH